MSEAICSPASCLKFLKEFWFFFIKHEKCSRREWEKLVEIILFENFFIAHVIHVKSQGKENFHAVFMTVLEL